MGAHSSIAYKMTRIVVLLTLVLSLIIGSLQVAWDYQQKLENFKQRVSEVINSSQKAAVKAVYTFDSDLASEVASGLFEFQPITNVIIRDENQKIMTTLHRYRSQIPYFALTQYLYKKSYVYHQALTLDERGGETIGSLTITVTPHEMAEEFLHRSLNIFSAAIIQSFVISILLLIIFHRMVTRPLQLLASDFTKIDPEKPGKDILSLDRKLKKTEFEEVTRAGNRLLRVIGSQLRARDRAEQKLLQQKNETERYLKIAEAIILQLDKNGRIIMINQRGLDVMGYELSEVLGKDWFDLAVPDHEKKALKRVFLDLFNSQRNGDDFEPSSYFENDILTKDGTKKRIFWHNALEFDPYGEAIGLLSSGQDVTERKEAEAALRTSEGNLRAIIEATSEGFTITDMITLKLMDINSAFHMMLGYSREEMLFKNVLDFVHPEDYAFMKSKTDNSITQPHRLYEVRMMRRDGSSVPVEINASNLPSELSEHPRSVAFITDITERKKEEEKRHQLELQLRQAQKMETIGTLAGGIAHDFNNILTPILGYSSLISSRIPKNDPNYERIQQIAKSANRAAEMIKQILTFSRKSEGEMASSYITPTVEEALQLVQSTTPSNIEIKKYINQHCPPVMADNTQIQQLVLNLCTNANQAMAADGGILEVKLDLYDVNEENIHLFNHIKKGTCLKLSVQDTGHGMDQETMSRVFDPFFTTKKGGEGTGLGLAMVHGIVQNHKGDIFVESEPGHGTTFSIYFPISKEPVQAEREETSIISGNMELVMIVDDETLNTEFLSELLMESGYRYEAYNDSIEALDAFLINPDKYQIILTDQTMPKLSGDQLVRAVRELRDDIPIIMMSGYDKNITIENAMDFGVDVYIQKPVSIEELTNSMHALLYQDYIKSPGL